VTNTLDINKLPENDFRKSLPRYQEEYADNNTNLAKEFAALATNKNCTAAQLALAWVLSRSENIIPIPGTKKRKYLEENAAATDIIITDEDLQKIESLLLKYPDTGDRYNESNYKLVDKS
jgi:aryl-alcohol dehydrogenase-like predicted oxidoreductase